MEILYSDPELVAAVKPVGVGSEDQPGGMPQLLREALGGDIYPVHRLDLNVGGVMVYARTKNAAAALSQAIADGSMTKEYRALVHGVPPQSGIWQDLLFKNSRKNKVYVVKRERKGVKKAVLEFQRLTDTDPALVHIRLRTGRSHQIRVQFASRGYPLVGDHKYGARDNACAPALHSCRIRLCWKGMEKIFEHFPSWTQVLH